MQQRSIRLLAAIVFGLATLAACTYSYVSIPQRPIVVSVDFPLQSSNQDNDISIFLDVRDARPDRAVPAFENPQLWNHQVRGDYAVEILREAAAQVLRAHGFKISDVAEDADSILIWWIRAFEISGIDFSKTSLPATYTFSALDYRASLIIEETRENSGERTTTLRSAAVKFPYLKNLSWGLFACCPDWAIDGKDFKSTDEVMSALATSVIESLSNDEHLFEFLKSGTTGPKRNDNFIDRRSLIFLVNQGIDLNGKCWISSINGESTGWTDEDVFSTRGFLSPGGAYIHPSIPEGRYKIKGECIGNYGSINEYNKVSEIELDFESGFYYEFDILDGKIRKLFRLCDSFDTYYNYNTDYMCSALLAR